MRGLWNQYSGVDCSPHPRWQSLSERSQKDYMAYSVPLLRVMGEAPVAAIKPHHISRYLTKERADAPVRANREISLLSILLTIAVEQGDIDFNPCSQIGKKNKERPRTTVPKIQSLPASQNGCTLRAGSAASSA